MDHFTIPVIIIPENRKTAVGVIDNEVCRIKIPGKMVRRSARTVALVDRLFWSAVMKSNTPALLSRTAELNRIYFDFQYRSVRFHRQFRRWGSCSSLGNLNLSHRLIGAPSALLDYVIIHELAHLKVLNHSKDFWNLVRQAVDDPRRCRREIVAYSRMWDEAYRQWLGKMERLILHITG